MGLERIAAEDVLGVWKGSFTQRAGVGGDPSQKAEVTQFEMRVYQFDPSTGLFVAEGIDAFGRSAIIGAISDEEIKFDKYYAVYSAHDAALVTLPSLLHSSGERYGRRGMGQDFMNFRIIEYAGEIFPRTGKLHAKGSWWYSGIRVPDGSWTLQAH